MATICARFGFACFSRYGRPGLLFWDVRSPNGIGNVESDCGTALLAWGGLPVRKDLPVREDCGYIRPRSASMSPFRDRPVTGSHLLGSDVCRVLRLWMPNLLFRLKPWTLVGDFRLSGDPCWWYTMQSGTALPVVDQAGAAYAAGNPLPGAFLGFDLNCRTDFMIWIVLFLT